MWTDLAGVLTGVDRRKRRPRVLLTGWFSLVDGGATAGDVESAQVVRRWLTEAGVSADLALAQPSEGGVAWEGVRPDDYTHIFFVCGPIWGRRPDRLP